MLDRLKAELHLHGNINFRLPYCPLLLDSTTSVEQIIKQALVNDIKIIAITDHNSLQNYHQACEYIKKHNLDLILVPAIEISSKDGHILAYGITKLISKGLSVQKTIDLIHQQNGLAVAAHPFLPFALGNKIYDLNLDLIEGFNSQTSLLINRKAQKAAQKLNLPWIAGSDAHLPCEIGKSYIYFPNNIKSWHDVIRCLEKGDFSVVCRQTRMLPMVIKYVFNNLIFQIKKGFKNGR